MVVMDTSKLLEPVTTLARQAGDGILSIYNTRNGTEFENKVDGSPLTKADLLAHEILVRGLKKLSLDIPILSEEDALPDFSIRTTWKSYWIIDPLDGTKEFINRTDEFTVNVALIEDGIPVLGVVHVPAENSTYFGQKGLGSWLRHGDHTTPISIKKMPPSDKLRIVASRRHGEEALRRLLGRFSAKGIEYETISIGSSLKLCLVAEGRADFYPRLAPTSEWDTAAGQAIVEAAGGIVTDTNLKPLRYNQKENIQNPSFYVLSDPNWEWSKYLGEN